MRYTIALKNELKDGMFVGLKAGNLKRWLDMNKDCVRYCPYYDERTDTIVEMEISVVYDISLYIYADRYTGIIEESEVRNSFLFRW